MVVLNCALGIKNDFGDRWPSCLLLGRSDHRCQLLLRVDEYDVGAAVVENAVTCLFRVGCVNAAADTTGEYGA